MSAAIQDLRDIGPVQERFLALEWILGDASGEIELKARYRVNYPSLRHRGLGREADVQLISVESRNELDEWRIARLNPAQWAAVIAAIETDELPQD